MRTTFTSDKILNLYRGTTFTAPAAVYAGLLTAVTDAEAGTVTETTYGAYARQAITFGAPVLTINKDFNATVLDAPTMQVYVAAVSQAGLPVRLLLEAWQKGGRIPEDTNLDELEVEMMANAQAAADAKAQIQADALATAQAGGAQAAKNKQPPALAA